MTDQKSTPLSDSDIERLSQADREAAERLPGTDAKRGPFGEPGISGGLGEMGGAGASGGMQPDIAKSDAK